jgi:hypothetical protein
MSNQVTPNTNNKTQPIHFAQRDIVFESGGVKFIVHVSADMSGAPNPPQPPNPVTPVTPVPEPKPEPQPSDGGGIALDGVKQMFAENKNAKCPPFFIDLNNPDKDNKVFATTYGSDTVKFEKPMEENGLKFVRNKGHAQTYASGAPPGKSCRFHHTPDGGMFTPGKHSWKDTPIPDYLYSEKCYYNFEMTVIARVGKALGTHQSFAFKVRSRPDKPDDSLRSTVEFCMPNDQKGDPYFNFNYDHKTYAKVSGVKQYAKEGKVEVGKWIGVKLVSIVADDKKSVWFALYVDPNPIAADGKLNNNWKLKAEYTTKGIPEYKNIPPIWGGMTNYLRVDGYEYVDLARYSIMEIEKGPLKNPAMLDNAPGVEFTIAPPAEFNPADFNSPPDNETGGQQQVPQQDPSKPQAPPQTEVTTLPNKPNK